MAPRADAVIVENWRCLNSDFTYFLFYSGQLFAKDELKKLLKEIDRDEKFWTEQRPKFESIFKEVKYFPRESNRLPLDA